METKRGWEKGGGPGTREKKTMRYLRRWVTIEGCKEDGHRGREKYERGCETHIKVGITTKNTRLRGAAKAGPTSRKTRFNTRSGTETKRS